MQNQTINKTVEILQFGLDFVKDMSASDWIRAPFLILGSIIKFLLKNFVSIIIIIVTLVILYYLIKFFRWYKREDKDDEKGVGEEDYETFKDEDEGEEL